MKRDCKEVFFLLNKNLPIESLDKIFELCKAGLLFLWGNWC